MPGDSLQLKAISSAQTSLTSAMGLIWTSSNLAITSVEGAGVLTANGPGVDTIQVCVGRTCGRITVDVRPRDAGIRDSQRWRPVALNAQSEILYQTSPSVAFVSASRGRVNAAHLAPQMRAGSMNDGPAAWLASGEIVPLGSLGGAVTLATGISDQGLVVWQSQMSSSGGARHAVYWNLRSAPITSIAGSRAAGPAKPSTRVVSPLSARPSRSLPH